MSESLDDLTADDRKRLLLPIDPQRTTNTAYQWDELGRSHIALSGADPLPVDRRDDGKRTRTDAATQARVSRCERTKELVRGYLKQGKTHGEIAKLMREKHDDGRNVPAWTTFISRHKL